MPEPRSEYEIMELAIKAEAAKLARGMDERQEAVTNSILEQFMTSDHADIDTGDGLRMHMCFQNPCTHA